MTPPALILPLISALFISPFEIRFKFPQNFEPFQFFEIVDPAYKTTVTVDRKSISVVGGKSSLLLDAVVVDGRTPDLLLFSCNNGTFYAELNGNTPVRLEDADQKHFCINSERVPELIISNGFIGCIIEIVQNGQILLRNFCRRSPLPLPQSDEPDQQLDDDPEWPFLDSDELFPNDGSPRPTGLEPLYLAEPLVLDEGGQSPLQWNNLYVFPYHSRFNISNKEIIFRLVDGPQHGTVQRTGRPLANFTYQQVLAKEIVYSHDGSETLEDAIDLQVDMKSPVIKFPSLEHQIYSLPIRIRPLNDPPELRLGPHGGQIRMAKKSRMPLSEQLIHLSDVDDEPHRVIVRVTGATGVHLELRNGRSVNEFTQRELLNDQVRLIHDGTDDKCELRLVAEDTDSQSLPITLQISTVSAEVHLERNTGISVLQQSSSPITAANLSFISNVPDSMINYTIVDLPEFGVVECEDVSTGQYRICSDFQTADLVNGRIRYRHSSTAYPTSDSFSFQVRSSNATSSIHRFAISFIPVHVKVFNRDAFLLNATDSMFLNRQHLFAWTFPKMTIPAKLVYHIVEPPKYGILQRRIEANKNRRIGVSSNFTQQHIDQQLIFYKLHFIQYTVINDYFTFRVVSPSVTSELVRFDITYVPGVGAIQLINRTIIVEEGSTQQITNYTLSLETPDDNNFAFTIGVAPSAGSILLVSAIGAKSTLALGHNFTTSDIKDGRVYFEQDGSELAEDRMYLVAESVYRRTGRVPFWLSIRVILVNDNPPTLSTGGDVPVDVVERGERKLDRSLLPWQDADIDSQPLQYHFRDPYRNAAILTVRAPHIPVRNFTDRELAAGQLLLRHLGLSADFTMPYTVSDGVHTVDAQLHVMAEQPFLRITTNTGLRFSDAQSAELIPVTGHNLTSRTNLDVNASQIVYRILNGSDFVFNDAKDRQKRVESFTQEDINTGKLSVAIGMEEPHTVAFTVLVGRLSANGTFRILRRQAIRATLEMRHLSPVTVPISSMAQISGRNLQAVDSLFPPNEVRYSVTKQPISGTLILESQSGKETGVAIAPGNFFVSEFTQENVNLGHLQYLHSGSLPSRDAFGFNVSTNHNAIGPYTMYINVVDDQLELYLTNASLLAGGNLVLGESLITTVSHHQDDHLEYRIVSAPTAGWIVLDSWRSENISSITAFTSEHVKNRQLFYVNDGRSSSQTDRIGLIVCFSELKCTEPKQLHITVRQRNLRGPQLIRNEVLRIWNGPNAPITGNNLYAQDDDTSPDLLHYIISRPTNGFLTRQPELNVPIFNFSQAEVDQSRIVFVKAANTSQQSGGFSFLVSDGLHQIGPDWFTVETDSTVLNVALEANGRLLTAPGPAAVIGMDLLRANIPHVTPEQIIFRIIKTPKLGTVLVAGLPSREFSQAAINRRAVAYRTRKETIPAWAKKDWFHFVVISNGSTADPINEEHRFRILITYAALPPDRIPLYVSTTPIVVGAGGSTALNSSHIDLSRVVALIGEPILVEVARLPRNGRLQWVAPLSGQNTTIINSELLRYGTSLIYHHDGGPGNNGDEMLLHLYPVSEANKRGAIRLRIHVRIETTEQLDPSLRIESFPSTVDLVSGSRFPLSGINFAAASEHVKPTSIVFEVTQPGRRVGVWVDDQEQSHFTQADVNKGRVHLAQRDPKIGTWNQSIDLVGIRIGHLTRVLLVHVQPIALQLINHTTISYPQGKTYIVLNSTHLGAFSNGERRMIIYSITRKPENGTFYWVAGEKEATAFSQADIDEGKVLYAQLNMNSYQDSFEFSIGNDEDHLQQGEHRRLVKGRSNITVTCAVKPQRLIAEAGEFVPITVAHLNATNLQGSAPRFLVMRGPHHGRIVVINSKTANETMAAYFTFANVQNGQVFYISAPIDRMPAEQQQLDDRFEFELRADSIQPARAVLRISIRRPPIGTAQPATRPPPFVGTTPWLPNVSQLSDNLPMALLAGILAITILIVYCRRRSVTKKRKKKERAEKIRKQKEHEEAERRILPEEQPDLLDTTVYATVARHKPRGEMLRSPPLKTFDATVSSTMPMKRTPKLSTASLALSGGAGGGSTRSSLPALGIPPSSGTFSGGSTLQPVMESAYERPRSGSTGQKSRSTTSGSAVSSIIHRPMTSAGGTASTSAAGRSTTAAAAAAAVAASKLKGNQYWV